jgi:two-component sensor histidine kinase
MLAAVLALTKLSQSDTPDGLKQAIEGRIRALANVHSLFVQSRWIGAELSAVAKQELAPFAEEARVQIDGPQMLLEPGAAQAMGSQSIPNGVPRDVRISRSILRSIA